MRLQRGWKFALLALVLAAGLYSVYPFFLRALGRFLITSDSLTKADAILVLDGGSERAERLLHATELWREGYAPVVVLSAKLASWQSYEDYPAWRYARKFQLLPAGALLVAAHDADSTKEEARVLLPFAKKHRYKTVIIVTSNFHTGRAKRVYRKEWAGSAMHILVSAAPTHEYHPDDWWKHRTDGRTFFFEFAKTLWYAVME